MILVALAFVFKLGLGSVVSLIGVILMAAGVWLTLGWSALKAKETKK